MGNTLCCQGIRNCLEDPLGDAEPCDPSRRAVVCLHGMMSCAMMSKQENSHLGCYPEWCHSNCKPCCGNHEWQLAWVNVRGYLVWCEPLYLVDSLQLRLVEGQLADGTKVPTTVNLEGVETRVVNGLAGIRSLNPGNFFPVNVWGKLVDRFRGEYNLVCFNYDWRRWGDPIFTEELLHRFRALVASTAARCGPVSLIGHSMGTHLALHFLSKLGPEWTQQYIRRVILVAPAVVGCPYMFEYLASGPDKLPIRWFPESVLQARYGIRTWPCLVANFPQAVGETQPWPTDRPLVVTPGRSYGVGDVGQFLEDIAERKGVKIGKAMWPYVRAQNEAIVPPPVAVHAIYGSGTATPDQLEWYTDDFLGDPTVRSRSPGDGTILASSIKALAAGWGGTLRLHEVTRPLSHRRLIGCKETLTYLAEVLSSP